MKKLVMIINGKGGVGKDALCEALEATYRVTNISAITPIKEIAAMHGWQGEKTPKARRFLAELKRVFVDYNDLPTAYLVEQYHAFEQSDAHILCVHIREPEEIDKFVTHVTLPCITMLIRRRAVDMQGAYGNAADDGVHNYPYSHVFDNDLPLEESQQAFSALLGSIIDEIE